MWLRDLFARIPEAARPREVGATGRPLSTRLAEPSASFRTVPERFVQDIWYGLLFDTSRVHTTDGVAVRIIDTGTPNTDGGPDFLGARLVIDGIEWNGDVEIHVRSSDWIAHRHQDDPVYDRVILHVALVADIWTGRLERPDNTPLPEVILLPFLGQPVRRLFRALRVRSAADPIACAGQLRRVPPDLVAGWSERLGFERMRERKGVLAQNLAAAGGIEALLYHAVFEALGYSKNGGPMLDLARRVPLALLRQHTQSGREALLLGGSGLLEVPLDNERDPRPTYVNELRDYFGTVPTSAIVPMRQVVWTWFRLRPSNFPTLRIAQGAALFETGSILGSGGIEAIDVALRGDGLPALRRLVRVAPGPFWSGHLRLDRPTAQRSAALGVDRADRIIVNAILPVALLHAEQTGNTSLIQHVYRIYGQLPAEQDERVGIFASRGIEPENMIQSQGLHQLYRSRCRTAGCLSCVIGRYLLSDHSIRPDAG